MPKLAKGKIVILGCGNLAWHIAKKFKQLKEYTVFVYNHQPNPLLNDFKNKLNCITESNLNEVVIDADFYFVCVTDKFVAATAKKIMKKNSNSIFVHTSGSLKIEALGNVKHAGVFYPLQTFSKNDELNWSEIPIVVEAKTSNAKNKLLKIASQFSKTIIKLSYKERLRLHLAAVLVNNFTNALVVAAEDFISKSIPPQKVKILLPLLKQTVLKLEKLGTLAAQTGPAKRNDETVINKHLKLISDNSDLKKVYKQMSKLILKQQTQTYA